MVWLNYLFREGVAPEEMQDAFEAMFLAQYHYAALEKLNGDLHTIIGVAFSPIAEKDIRTLSKNLKQLTKPHTHANYGISRDSEVFEASEAEKASADYDRLVL
jgi:hypothetical protein